jgi:hypothetical protein
MKTLAIAAVMAAFLAAPPGALALRCVSETFGNATVAKSPEWADGVLGVVNLKSRFYFTHSVGGLANAVDENFYYKGDARDLGEALRKFAAVKADDRQLILLPGPGKARSFGGGAFAFNWQLQVRNGICKEITGSKHAVLKVYVDAQTPRGSIDRDKARQWIRELDDDSFETRTAASRELEKLGAPAKPLLREALKTRPSLEAYRRIEALLARFKGLDAGDLEIPEGVAFVTPSDLLAAHLKDLSDTDLSRCNLAGGGLVELAPYSDKVVPALTARLEKGTSEYVRRVVASSLGWIGARANPALPSLKAGLADPDPNIRAAFQAAIDQIEKAKPEPERNEDVKKRMAILKDLDEFKKAGKK